MVLGWVFEVCLADVLRYVVVCGGTVMQWRYGAVGQAACRSGHDCWVLGRGLSQVCVCACAPALITLATTSPTKRLGLPGSHQSATMCGLTYLCYCINVACGHSDIGHRIDSTNGVSLSQHIVVVSFNVSGSGSGSHVPICPMQL
jgi:hypothetical protein